MRDTTADELTLLNSKFQHVTSRWRVQNASGTWKSLSALTGSWLGALNFVKDWSITDDIDAPTWTGTVNVAAERYLDPTTSISISPYKSSSPANVDDASAPAPLFEGMRRIEGYARSRNIDGSIDSEHRIFDGYITNWSQKGNAIAITISDLGHLLVITQIRSERIYDWNGVLLETAIQQVLDDVLGTGAITLAIDPAIAGTVTLSSKTKVERNKLMETIRGLAQNTVGANVRYKWKSDDTMALTLFMPPRTKTTPDFVFSRGLYQPNPDFKENTDDVRNDGVIKYQDSDKKAVVSLEYTVPASITKYKNRYFEFTEASTSQINTEAEATTFIKAAIDDLAQPKAEGQFAGLFNWAAETYDLYTLSAPTREFDEDQAHAITKLTHAGDSHGARTQYDTRGNIAGYSRRWIAVEGKGPTPENADDLSILASAYYEGSMYGNQLFNGKVEGCIWLILQWGLTVRRVHIWARESLPSVSPPYWPLTSSPMYKAVTLDRPEGKTPRVGNSIRASDGKSVWQMLLPMPTTPDSNATFIIQAEGDAGALSKQLRAGPYPAVDLTVGGDVAPLSGASATRISATTIHYEWVFATSGGTVLIMRDRVVIHMQTDGGAGPHTFDDEELHADRDYECAIIAFSTGYSGPRDFFQIPAWTETVAFATAPDLYTLPSGELRVRIYAPTGSPVGTDTIRIQKSVDSGHYDPWTTITQIALADFPYYDAVVLAGQFYRYQAVNASDVVLDTSKPAYWTSPL